MELWGGERLKKQGQGLFLDLIDRNVRSGRGTFRTPRHPAARADGTGSRSPEHSPALAQVPLEPPTATRLRMTHLVDCLINACLASTWQHLLRRDAQGVCGMPLLWKRGAPQTRRQTTNGIPEQTRVLAQTSAKAADTSLKHLAILLHLQRPPPGSPCLGTPRLPSSAMLGTRSCKGGSMRLSGFTPQWNSWLCHVFLALPGPRTCPFNLGLGAASPATHAVPGI